MIDWVLVLFLVWWIGGTGLMLWRIHLDEDVMSDTALAVLVFCAITGPMFLILDYAATRWGRLIPPWPFVVWRAKKRPPNPSENSGA